MKKIGSIFIFIALISNAIQGWDVFPDSNSNTLNLRISNTSPAFSIPNVVVTKQGMPSFITNFSPNAISIGNLGANQSATASFTFNVSPNASMGASGELSFQISAGSGDSWGKYVSLRVISPNGAIEGDVDVEGITETPQGAILTASGPVNRSITLGITGGYTLSDLPIGTYNVSVAKEGFTPVPASRNVRVNLGETTRGVDFKLIRPPQPPSLNSPANNSSVNTARPNFIWNTAQGGGNKRYRIQISTNNAFTQIVFDVSNITSTDYTPTSDLSNGTTYYWRVLTSNEAGNSNWSEIWSFRISIPPAKPSLSSPSNGSIITDTNDIALLWNSVSNANSYRIQLAKNSSFSPTIVDTTIYSTSYGAYNLDNNTTYYWRVLASNSIGDSPWSNVWNFRIEMKGNISGDVDGPGMSQSGATIQATGQVTKSVTTDWFGGYTIADLPPGYYTVTCSQQNYTSSPSSYYIQVLPGQTTSNIDFTLTSIYGKISGDVDSPDTWGQYNATIQASGPVTKSVRTGLAGGYTIDELTPGSYRVTCTKSGYTSNPSYRDVSVSAGQETSHIDFDLIPNQANAFIALSSPSSIRNASAYLPYTKALRGISQASTLTTPTIPILKTGEIGVSLITSMPLLNPPSLSYSIGDYLEKIELSGSGKSFTGKFYISSTTPEGTATFHYSGMDERGSISCYIELGENFIIDKTIYPDEGGEVSNEDGASVLIEKGAISLPVDITITQPEDVSPARFLPQTQRQFTASHNKIKEFTIVIPYQDDPSLVEDSLKIAQWDKISLKLIPQSIVDKERNKVRAKVNLLGTYGLIGTRVMTTIDNIIAYPNPWYVEKEASIKIAFIPLDSQPKLYIYNLAGELVREIREFSDSGLGYLEASWDGKNESGKNVAYGVYIYVIETNKGTKKGKIGLIR